MVVGVITEEYFNTVMSNVAAELQLKEWSYDKQKFKNIAQNYFGILIPVKLIGKICGKNVSFPIVLKLAPTDERYRVSGAITLMFAREIFVYSELLNRYRALLNDISLSKPYVIPEYYYVCLKYCNEVIAMEDMCQKGYEPYVKSMFLDLDHMTVALKSLAQFHALSYILEKKDEYFFEVAKKHCVALSEQTNKRFMDILINRLQRALEKFRNTSYIPLLTILERKCSDFIELANHSVKSLCLCHGDIWKENFLFQYNEDNLPISACIIDYQTTRNCSPAYDVLYLIISSTSADLRKDNFTQMLDIYYDAFADNITKANLNPHVIYNKNVFNYDLGIVGPLCLIVVNTAMWLSNGLQQEGHVRSKIILNTVAEKMEAEMRYRNIMTGIIDDLSSYGYLQIAFK